MVIFSLPLCIFFPILWLSSVTPWLGKFCFTQAATEGDLRSKRLGWYKCNFLNFTYMLNTTRVVMHHTKGDLVPEFQVLTKSKLRAWPRVKLEGMGWWGAKHVTRRSNSQVGESGVEGADISVYVERKRG